MGTRHQGRPETADAALQRLRFVACDRVKDDNVMLHFRLEEAMIMETRRDFTGAIRSAKTLIEHLRLIQRQNGALDRVGERLLADCLVKCGAWMADYKIEPAKSILDAYLKPAAQLSETIYNADSCRLNATRATNAFLVLGHLVSNLFDNISSRIQSTEWKNTGKSMTERENELQKCELMHFDVK
jgi:hypothetical protein